MPPQLFQGLGKSQQSCWDHSFRHFNLILSEFSSAKSARTAKPKLSAGLPIRQHQSNWLSCCCSRSKRPMSRCRAECRCLCRFMTHEEVDHRLAAGWHVNLEEADALCSAQRKRYIRQEQERLLTSAGNPVDLSSRVRGLARECLIGAKPFCWNG